MGAMIALACVGSGVQPEGADGACPNEERRVEQGAVALALPDCRAYELVSPGSIVFQDSDLERNLANGARASSAGSAFTYYTTIPAKDAETSGYFYLSTRRAGGWSVKSIAPQSAPAAYVDEECEANLYPSADLTGAIYEVGWLESTLAAHCKRNQEPLDPAEPDLYRNLFVNRIGTDSYRLVNVTPNGVSPNNASLVDMSDDFKRVLFKTGAKLTPETAGGVNLFLWEDGAIRLLNRLPDGSSQPGSLVEDGSGLATVTGASSADGLRVFFYVGGALYLRLNSNQPQSPVSGGACTDTSLACTVQVDASQGTGAGGGGNFWRADPLAARVLFTTDRKLTTDSTASTGRADLYEYDVEAGGLIDLTVNPDEPADVRGVSGASEDASHVYFVANGSLSPEAPTGSCRGTNDAAQTCSLYLAHAGSLRFIATLARADQGVWLEREDATTISRSKANTIQANASPNGRYFAFRSVRNLTGFDNRDPLTGQPHRQIFLYDAEANGGAGELSCVSCIPGGAGPFDSSLRILFNDSYGAPDYHERPTWRINSVLDDGSVLFDTIDPLVSEDVNERRDVYLYRHGEHRLISTGRHTGHARFFDANPDGSDIFFRTGESLVGADDDEGHVNFYDARVGGGFVEPRPPEPPCEGEGCRGAVASAAHLPLPATALFSGPGNPRASKKKPKRRRCGRAKRAKSRECTRGKRRGERKRNRGRARAAR